MKSLDSAALFNTVFFGVVCYGLDLSFGATLAMGLVMLITNVVYAKAYANSL
jgi:hypothetical protein